MASTLTTVCGASVRRFVKSSIDEIELDTEPTTAGDIVKKCMDRITSSHQHLDCTTESILKGCLWMVLPKPASKKAAKRVKIGDEEEDDGCRDNVNSKIRSITANRAKTFLASMTA